MHLTCIISFLADLVRYLWKTSTAFCTNPWGFACFFSLRSQRFPQIIRCRNGRNKNSTEKGGGENCFVYLLVQMLYIYNYVFTCIHTIPHIQTTTHIYVIHIFVRIFIQYVNIYVRMFREVYLYIHVTCMYFRSVSLQSMIYNICLQYNYTYIHTYIHLKTHDTLYARKLS